MIKKNKKTAFTLVELLVCISVIALLLSILVPSLNRAREFGKSILCLSNLRQMAIAADIYAQSNDRYYPIGYYEKLSWDFSRITVNGKTKIIPGLLWGGQTIEKIQQCPSYKGKPSGSDPYTGYNYNTSYIGHGMNEDFDDTNYNGEVKIAYDKWGTEAFVVMPAKVDMVKKPANCAIFGDGGYAAGSNKFMRSPFFWAGDTSNLKSAGTQDFRHLKKTNVSWCDGHASSQKERYTNIEKGKVADGTGFLSQDNSLYDLE